MSFKVEPVNAAYWDLSQSRRKKKYDEYVAWFNTEKKSQAGCQRLVEGKRFSGWARIRKTDGEWDPKDFQPDGWGLFCMNTADPEKLIAAAAKAQLRDKAVIQDALKHVGGNPGSPLLNPEYLDRAQNSKKLREKLQAYTGSREAASDLLFEAKKEADAKGLDFSKVAAQKTEEMVGKIGESEPVTEIIAQKPKRTLSRKDFLRYVLPTMLGLAIAGILWSMR